MKIIEVIISKNQLERAGNLYQFNSLKGSITKGKSNLYGALGEIIVHDYFKLKGYEVDFNSTYDYDLVINGFKVDVKTKRVRTIPEPHHLASISSFNIKQKCHIYMFARIMEDCKKGYLLGYKVKSDFFEQATYNKKGEEDWNGWKFKDDCYNLKVDKLNTFNTI